MKKQLLVLGALGLFIICTAEISSENGRAGYTNSPGESNCTNCHGDFNVNTGGGSIYTTSNMTNWKYVPGQTYTINVIVKKTGMGLFGFGIEALSSTNANAGTFVITNTAKTQLKNASSGRVNVVHKMNGGLSADSSVFSFNWTAPATNIGNVTLYYAGDACNNDGNESGDYVYTGTKVLTPVAPLITRTPTTLTGFTATLTTPSTPKTFVVSATNLTDSVKITAPTEYQVSLSSTTGWKKTFSLAKNASNALPATTIYVRYKPITAGVDSGNVTLKSTGAVNKTVKVKGTSTPRLASSDQPFETNEIVLAPNPVSDKLSILNIVSEGPLNISIYDLAGHKMQAKEYASDEMIAMNVSGLKSGLYICRIESETGTIVKKFVKQ